VLVVLEQGERAPGLPADTAATPYQARVRGFLEADAQLGDLACVRTLAGRRVTGALQRLAPAPGHSFGEPVEELLAAGDELRERLATREATDA
jgi:hypothetical protein